MRRSRRIAVLLCILLLGAVLRLHNFSKWPREGATFDEFAWTWQGMSLIKNGVPVSWSSHPQYKETIAYKNPKGANFNLVNPYLEHPPLFGIVAGAFAYLRGARAYDDVTVALIRPLSLALGVISIFAVFLLARLLYGPFVGLASAFIYAIIPSVVVGSRILQNENFFIPLFIFSLYWAFQYIKTNNNKYFIFGVLSTGLLPLAKIPWIAGSVAVVAIFLLCRRYWQAGLAFLISFISLALYGAYGFMYDWQLFVSLMKLQLARYDMAFNSIFALFTNPIVTDRFFIDGWIYVGWMALGFLLLRDVKKNAPVIMGFLAYFIIYITGIPNEPGHGWYRYPFYPFLAISLGVFFKENFNKNPIMTFVSLLLIGLSLLQHTWFVAFGFSYVVLRVFILFCLLGLLSVISRRSFVRKFTSFINFSMLVNIIILTIWTIAWYNEQ